VPPAPPMAGSAHGRKKEKARRSGLGRGGGEETRTPDPLHAKRGVEGVSNLIGGTTKIATAEFPRLPRASIVRPCSPMFVLVQPTGGVSVVGYSAFNRSIAAACNPKRDVSVNVQGHPSRTPSHAMRNDEHILAPFYCKNVRCMTEGMGFQITDFRLSHECPPFTAYEIRFATTAPE
jgi:hypothetical protein